jgi:hypothetical protein
MADLSVLILCGRSPRHLYVANRLCRSAQPLAIVQETGTPLTPVSIGSSSPARLWRKGWRWLRDRRRYLGDGEANSSSVTHRRRSTGLDLVCEVPHVDDQQVVDLAKRLDPDVIAVFGTSLIKGPLLELGGAESSICMAASLPNIVAPIARSGRCTTANPKRSDARFISSTRESIRAS